MHGLVLSGVKPSELTAKGYSSEEIWKNIWQAATRALFEFYKTNYEQQFARGVLFPKTEQVTTISEDIAFAVVNKIREMLADDKRPPLDRDSFRMI